MSAHWTIPCLMTGWLPLWQCSHNLLICIWRPGYICVTCRDGWNKNEMPLSSCSPPFPRETKNKASTLPYTFKNLPPQWKIISRRNLSDGCASNCRITAGMGNLFTQYLFLVIHSIWDWNNFLSLSWKTGWEKKSSKISTESFCLEFGSKAAPLPGIE